MVFGHGLRVANQPIIHDALVRRWPGVPMRAELVRKVLFGGAFGQRGAVIAQRTCLGRRLPLKADGNIGVRPAGIGPARSLLDRHPAEP